jgi:hypothetical protein
VRFEHVQDVLEQGNALGSQHRAGGYQGGQPPVSAHDRACLLADVDEVGQPVPGGGSEGILGPG